MAAIKMKNAELTFDFETVKQLTEDNKNFVFEDIETPLFVWRFGEVCKEDLAIKDKPLESAMFTIDRSNVNGKLRLKYSYGQLFLSIHLTVSKKKNKTSHPFQVFIVQIGMNNCRFRKEITERCFFSTDALNLNAAKHVFKFDGCYFDFANIVVRLYQEPSAMLDYRSPFQNAVVGKIERFKALKEPGLVNKFVSVSPRFSAGGTPEQLVVARFWFSKPPPYDYREKPAIGLSANLLFLSQSGPTFPFVVTFTIFSQVESVMDSVSKVIYRQDDTKSDFYTLLVLNQEFGAYLEDDTIYYKVVVEPYLTK